MVFRKLHKELSGTLHHFLEVEWYAAHLFWISVVRGTIHLDLNGTPHILWGLQKYAATFICICMAFHFFSVLSFSCTFSFQFPGTDQAWNRILRSLRILPLSWAATTCARVVSPSICNLTMRVVGWLVLWLISKKKVGPELYASWWVLTLCAPLISIETLRIEEMTFRFSFSPIC